jgi:hypothetical protein
MQNLNSYNYKFFKFELQFFIIWYSYALWTGPLRLNNNNNNLNNTSYDGNKFIINYYKYLRNHMRIMYICVLHVYRHSN